jgi:sorting nexin-9/18/33
MARQVRAIYDFDAEPGTGEVSIRSGEVITVTRTDVGEGWWEGTRPNGQTGLFPEAYVEEVVEEAPPPVMAPPPLPQDYSGNSPVTPATPIPLNTFGTSNPVEDWNSDPWSGVASEPAPPQQSNNDWGGNDDDWDSDFDDESASQVGGGGTLSAPQYSSNADSSGKLALPEATFQRGSTGDLTSAGRDKKTSGSTGKASFNRFSVYVKSGSENYILGKVNLQIPELDALTVLDNGDGRYSWLNTNSPFSCVVASPKKEAKFKGLKSYIAYQLTPSVSTVLYCTVLCLPAHS